MKRPLQLKRPFLLLGYVFFELLYENSQALPFHSCISLFSIFSLKH
jgi:hypothetical protein